MAVSPMKLVTIVGPLDEFDNLVRSCIINQDFHPESAMSVMRHVKGLLPFESDNPYSELLRQAELISDRTGIELAYREFPTEGYDTHEISAWFKELEKRHTDLIMERAQLNQRILENEQIQLHLERLHDVDVDFQEFFHFAFVKFRYGRMPRDIFTSFFSHVKERNDVYFFHTSIEQDYVYGMYMTPRVSTNMVDAWFSSLQFERIRLSDRVMGTQEQAVQNLKEDSAKSKRRLAAVEMELSSLRNADSRKFLSYYSFLRFQSDSYGLRQYAAHTNESFYLLGWVPSDKYQAFSKGLTRFSSSNFISVGEDPSAVSDYMPPIKLKNRRVFKPFEPFVSMYGLPGYNEIDPTPLMALTYSILFGIMFGDVGQGALLILAGFLMWQFKKMWLGKIICYVGASSMCFGFFYGSIFGNEHILPGFKVLESTSNSQLLLTVSIYGGAGLVTLAILFNIANGLRQRKPDKIFFSSGGLAGLILYWGIVLMILPLLGFGKAIVSTSVLVACIIIPLLLVFLCEPISKLCEGNKNWKPHEGTGNFLISGFFELFETLLSFLTNTLSFLRVGAYAISHASMMTVVFSLAKNANTDEHNIIVLIIGNIVVAGIEGLLVGIQVLRLDFYELFGRFYTANGRPYSPVIIDYTTRKD